jgi:thermitase
VPPFPLRFVTCLLLLAVFLSCAPAAPAYAAEAGDPLARPGFVPGELIIRLPAANARAGANLTPQLAAAGVQRLRTIPELGLAVVTVPPSGDPTVAAASLAASGAVEWAEPNYTFALDYVPDDRDYQAKQTPYLKWLKAEDAWEITLGNPQVILAVLDTGVDTGHEDLSGAIWTNPGEVPGNGVDDDGNGFVDDVNGWDFADNHAGIDDDHGHGTHVAGIAAASIGNGKGIAGLAGGVTIMPVDVFGGGIGTYEDLIRAIVYATDNGAHVINMSLGASSYSRGEAMAINYAVENGVVVVAAAGNQGREAYHYPAAHENVIAVASTTAQDVVSSFSNRGTFIDVAAPGSSVWSTFPGDRYGSLSGTSMATPHVAGLAALILSRNAGLAPSEVRQIIEGAADDLGAAGYDIVYGHGRINAGRALSNTPPGTGDPRDVLPPLDMDLPGCEELLVNGGFEAGQLGWDGAGGVHIVGDKVYTGEHSAFFPGAPEARSVLAQAVTVPAGALSGLVTFAFRIEPVGFKDWGYGSTPEMPYDDWFRAELTTPDGTRLLELLETGNTADSAPALPWDRYVYRLEGGVLAELQAAGDVRLVFTAQNDSDADATGFWLDAVRFCVLPASPPGEMQRTHLPLVLR